MYVWFHNRGSWDSEKKGAEKDLPGFLAHKRKIVKYPNRITVQSNKQPMNAPPSVFPQINPRENKQTNKAQLSNSPRPAMESVGTRGMQRAND